MRQPAGADRDRRSATGLCFSEFPSAGSSRRARIFGIAGRSWLLQGTGAEVSIVGGTPSPICWLQLLRARLAGRKSCREFVAASTASPTPIALGGPSSGLIPSRTAPVPSVYAIMSLSTPIPNSLHDLCSGTREKCRETGSRLTLFSCERLPPRPPRRPARNAGGTLHAFLEGVELGTELRQE
jgi:hypothetical protein